MHEYILHAQLPVVRGRQVLNILAGVTASQPVPIREQHLILADRKEQPVVSKKPKQQPKQPQYRQLVRHVAFKDDGSLDTGPWQLRSEQTPDPGMPNFTSRHADLQDKPEELEKLKEKYDFRNEFTLIGHRFVYGNVVVRVVRIHIPVNKDHDPTASPDGLILLDPSGNWLVEAATRVEDLSSSELTDKAKKDLLAFQTLMEGAIDFYTPDRFALDTRIKNV
ncbi:hypothetical protein PRZ48_012715 [Zasmidium cellare]|uniref:Mediator of RNA polymerase II transcription subunit 18 n=1 Tax=Zasmidium cellare TaxID=395010 RepID=A0ABR0E5N8_ZASCE|nr:hypothetical protein PRZ48_012715 [Zasmidium cellare]